MSSSPRNILLPPPLRTITVLRNLLQDTQRHAALEESHRPLIHRYETIMRRTLVAVDAKNNVGRALVAAELAEMDVVLAEMEDYMAERRVSMAATMDTASMCKSAVEMDLRRRGGEFGNEEWEECVELIERVEGVVQQVARMSTADCGLMTELAQRLRGREGIGEIVGMTRGVMREEAEMEIDEWDWNTEANDFDDFGDDDELWEAVSEDDDDAP